MTIKKENVGKSSYDLLMQEHKQFSAIEYEREMHKDYEKEINACIKHHSNIFKEDFFVVVLRKRERLKDNVLRTYFFGRRSCPTPTYDQTVYKYSYHTGDIEFIWTIPDLETCTVMNRDALLVPKEERDLLNFVFDFYSGVLDMKAAILNNEVQLVEG